MTLCLGKLPATKDTRDLTFAKYRTAKQLPQAPVGFGHTALVQSPWGMLGNDTLGDCAIAGPMHETMLLNALAGRQVAFTDRDAVAAYSAITGYNPANPNTDQGSNVRDVLKYRAKTGLTDAAGAIHKIGAYVALEPGNWAMLLEALQVFETVGIGIQFPGSAMDQFNAHEPWSVVKGASIEGGHYIPVVSRPATEMVDIVTWGAVQGMEEAFYSKYCDEAWAYISLEDIAAGRTIDGFDLEALTADLALL